MFISSILPLNALSGEKIVGEHHPVASRRGIDLHVLVEPEAEQVRHAFAHLDHRERRTGARLDHLDQLCVLQRRAFHLQSHVDDGPADVISDGSFERLRQEDERNEEAPQNSFLTRISSA